MDDRTTLFRARIDSRPSVASGFGLPADVVASARRRVKILALLVLLGAGGDLVQMLAALVFGDVALADVGTAGILAVTADVLTIIASLVVLFLARSPRVGDSSLLRAALVFEIVLCLVVSLANPVAVFASSGALPGITWVTPLIILFPLIVPCPPRRTLMTAIVAAATRPIGLLILQSLGLVLVSTEAVLSGSFSPAVAVVIAFFGSRVVYGMGLEVAEARRMGSYELERLLGRGGMGEVWLARHRMLARPAAVKLVRPDALGPDSERAHELVRRFEREAQATASMRSPNTIMLYDFGVSADGTFYYVMELLDGLDAQSLVQRFGPVTPARAVHLLRQVCHSLAEAHTAGLIHRDIKPANIYVCRLGLDADFVKVLDFGLVKTPADEGQTDPHLTPAGTVSGTPAFMAPEQAIGPQRADARSDLYAVGCFAYWLVTGQLVFEGATSVEILMHHVQTAPVPPSERTDMPVPAALDQLILRCLDKDPVRRPQTASELAAALDACVTDESWTEEVWTGERARRWWESHRPGPDEAPPVQSPVTGQ